MLSNFAFTLYELLGYLLPGGVCLVAFTLLYWTLFIPSMPLGISSFQPGIAAWTALLFVSYLLGHAAQAVGNMVLHGMEKGALDARRATAPKWLRERAREAAAKILSVEADQIEPLLVFRTLDEFVLQKGREGDRDMFIYREGFYRGTAIALFYLGITLLVRMAVPGSSIQFVKALYYVSALQLLTTSLIAAGVGWLFTRRYKRFVEYRVSRAVLAALVIQGHGDQAPSPPRSSD